MSTRVVVEEERFDLEIEEETTLAVAEQIGVVVLEVGEPGPSGADADGAFIWTTQVFNLVASQQEFELDFTPREGSLFVYLNGLLERFWSLVNTTLVLDDSAVTGDSIVISYQKEI